MESLGCVVVLGDVRCQGATGLVEHCGKKMVMGDNLRGSFLTVNSRNT